MKTANVILKSGSLINLIILDATELDAAQKWVGTQLRKKRKVYWDSSDKMDYTLFSTNLPSREKLEFLIPKKFRGFKARPTKLKLITDEANLTHDMKEPSTQPQKIEASLIFNGVVYSR